MTSQRLSWKDFLAQRQAVLETWPTGRDVAALEDGLRYQRTIPEAKNFAKAMAKAKAAGRTLLQPRAGVALIDDHIRLLRYLETEGTADLLPTTIDAYTRQNRYEEAGRGIERSRTAGTSLLNGFPAVNHGRDGCRKVTEAVTKPVQVRHGTPDARLLAEIALAGGFTSFEGGGISYNIPYAKKVEVGQCLRDWQYVDRLVGYYEENGVSVNREPFGPLTGTLVPPFISHTVAILEGLLALDQGVRSLTLGYGQGGNVLQDLAALETLRELADESFRAAGFIDFDLTLVFHQWMGGFPEDEAQAFSVIGLGGFVAAAGRVEKTIVKSPHEAMGIPTKEANASGLKATRQVLSMMADQRICADNDIVRREKELIRREVHALMDAVFAAAGDDLVQGVVRAFAGGLLDIPFAPSMYNKGKVLPIRDNEGAIRLFAKGGLPLGDDIMAFHRERLQERSRAEGRPVTFQMVTDDIYAISKGKLVGRPK
ncbi:MAG TPA: methylaspartate mutase subunit E [Candidatus Aminicenantes bacterium]|nr:methylaspartate mutase subunit E [Candidatus Aminicenantes bacterium]